MIKAILTIVRQVGEKKIHGLNHSLRVWKILILTSIKIEFKNCRTFPSDFCSGYAIHHLKVTRKIHALPFKKENLADLISI